MVSKRNAAHLLQKYRNDLEALQKAQPIPALSKLSLNYIPSLISALEVVANASDPYDAKTTKANTEILQLIEAINDPKKIHFPPDNPGLAANFSNFALEVKAYEIEDNKVLKVIQEPDGGYSIHAMNNTGLIRVLHLDKHGEGKESGGFLVPKMNELKRKIFAHFKIPFPLQPVDKKEFIDSTLLLINKGAFDKLSPGNKIGLRSFCEKYKQNNVSVDSMQQEWSTLFSQIQSDVNGHKGRRLQSAITNAEGFGVTLPRGVQNFWLNALSTTPHPNCSDIGSFISNAQVLNTPPLKRIDKAEFIKAIHLFLQSNAAAKVPGLSNYLSSFLAHYQQGTMSPGDMAKTWRSLFSEFQKAMQNGALSQSDIEGIGLPDLAKNFWLNMLSPNPDSNCGNLSELIAPYMIGNHSITWVNRKENGTYEIRGLNADGQEQKLFLNPDGTASGGNANSSQFIKDMDTHKHKIFQYFNVPFPSINSLKTYQRIVLPPNTKVYYAVDPLPPQSQPHQSQPHHPQKRQVFHRSAHSHEQTGTVLPPGHALRDLGKHGVAFTHTQPPPQTYNYKERLVEQKNASNTNVSGNEYRSALLEIASMIRNHTFQLHQGGVDNRKQRVSNAANEILHIIDPLTNNNKKAPTDAQYIRALEQIKTALENKRVETDGSIFGWGKRDGSTVTLYNQIYAKADNTLQPQHTSPKP